MVRITRDDAIFATEAFQRDAVAFNLIGLVRSADEPMLWSAGSQVVIACTAPQYPIWLWCAPDTTDAQYAEAFDQLECMTDGLEKLTVAAAMPVYDRLLERFGTHEHTRVLMTAYRCDQPKIEQCEGGISHPREDEQAIIAEFLAHEIEDIAHRPANPAEQMDAARDIIASPDFFVWRAPDGCPVAMALIVHRFEDQARINTVFTARDRRGRGYAGALVGRLCERVIAEGRIPMLYADTEYPPSNRTYRRIGFTECGRLAELRIIKG